LTQFFRKQILVNPKPSFLKGNPRQFAQAKINFLILLIDSPTLINQCKKAGFSHKNKNRNVKYFLKNNNKTQKLKSNYLFIFMENANP